MDEPLRTHTATPLLVADRLLTTQSVKNHYIPLHDVNLADREHERAAHSREPSLWQPAGLNLLIEERKEKRSLFVFTVMKRCLHIFTLDSLFPCP